MVEMVGVEPTSENAFTETSPSAFRYLNSAFIPSTERMNKSVASSVQGIAQSLAKPGCPYLS